MKVLEFVPLGDSAVLVKLGEAIDEDTHRKVKRLADHLRLHPLEGMVEAVPAFTSVTVFYDPVRLYAVPGTSVRGGMAGSRLDDPLPYEQIVRALRLVLEGLEESGCAESEVVEIPVCYGDEFGPDLDEVAERNGLRPDDVIRIHASVDYKVYMIGFAPGFPYLGGMDKRIAAPRRSTPRLAIPAGSVGIAGEQTGLYPLETPGGWQLIGRSPLTLFRPDSVPPTLLRMGQTVRFYPISRTEYARWEEKRP